MVGREVIPPSQPRVGLGSLAVSQPDSGEEIGGVGQEAGRGARLATGATTDLCRRSGTVRLLELVQAVLDVRLLERGADEPYVRVQPPG